VTDTKEARPSAPSAPCAPRRPPRAPARRACAWPSRTPPARPAARRAAARRAAARPLRRAPRPAPRRASPHPRTASARARRAPGATAPTRPRRLSEDGAAVFLLGHPHVSTLQPPCRWTRGGGRRLLCWRGRRAGRRTLEMAARMPRRSAGSAAGLASGCSSASTRRGSTCARPATGSGKERQQCALTNCGRSRRHVGAVQHLCLPQRPGRAEACDRSSTKLT